MDFFKGFGVAFFVDTRFFAGDVACTVCSLLLLGVAQLVLARPDAELPNGLLVNSD